MPHRIKFLILVLAVLTAVSLVGCDVSAERELRRAEKALDAALDVGADRYATEDYQAAEENLVEAAELARENRIQAARSLAIKSKLRAEDATRKAKEYQMILQDEEDRLYR